MTSFARRRRWRPQMRTYNYHTMITVLGTKFSAVCSRLVVIIDDFIATAVAEAIIITQEVIKKA